jgi:ribosomal protein S6E (S10)
MSRTIRVATLAAFGLLASSHAASGRTSLLRDGAPTGPSTLRLHVTDESGGDVPARVRLVPTDTAKRAAQLLQGATRSMVISGNASVRVQPGSYDVWVSRGPRHSMKRLRLQLQAGSVTTERVVLRELIPLPDHLCVDLHVHTSRSEDAHEEGGVSAVDLAAEGLDVAIATDHNVVGAMDGDLPSLPGVEVTSWAPEIGHFNAFPVQALPRFKDTTPRDLFRELHSNPHTFVQINHPRLDDHIAFFTLGGLRESHFTKPHFGVDGADGIEVFNGYDIARPEQVLSVLAEVTALHETGHRLTVTGGSDSHGRPGHVPGYPRTCVRTRNMGDLSRQLIAGDAFVTNGPLLDLRVQGATPGHRVHPDADGSVRVELSVKSHPGVTPERVEIHAGRNVALSVPFQPDARGEQRLSVRAQLHGARTVHARVVGGSGLDPFVERWDATPLAFTNPVYLRGAGSH